MTRLFKWIVLGFLLTGLSIFIFNKYPAKLRTQVVGIVPFEHFSSSLIDSIRTAIEYNYGFKTVILDNQNLPSDCFINVKSPRYRADKLIKHLRDERPDTIDYMLGLTDKDISTTKKDNVGKVKNPKSKYEDWGVFGLGYMPGRAAIVSSFRLTKPSLTISRLRKICTHELGHNLGLNHCTSGNLCVMNDAAESIRTIDNASFNLCSTCASTIE